MFYINLKRFIKSPVFLLGTLAYMIILYLMQPIHTATGIEDISNTALSTQTFSFFYFMMISYEFFYQIRRCRLDEIVSVSRMGAGREKIYGLLIFLGLDLILYIVYLTVSMIGTTSVLKEFNTDWLIMLVKAYFLYHFFTYFFAMLAGMLIAMIPSRIKGFFALVTVFSMFSRILYPIMMNCASDSEKWTHVIDIFGIMNRDYNVLCDLIYGYTTEAVNLQRILFWILLTLSGLSLVMNRIRKKAVTALLFLAACTVFIFYIQPSGDRYVYGNWGAYMDDQQYYSLIYNADPASDVYHTAVEHQGIGRKYKEPDFKILEYKGELTPGRVLAASLDVTVDRQELPEYGFTLYHGYVVKRVTDETGEELSFEQDIDHLLVRTNKAHRLKKIHFEYEGYSRKYVATSQAVFLAGNFPYLPNAGWNEYMIEPVGNHWQHGYNLKGAMYPVHYDIRFPTKHQMYSNLSESEDGRYVGTAEGATFVASPFVKEMRLKDGVVYYSVLATPYWKNNIEKTRETAEKSFQAVKGLDRGKKGPWILFDLANVMDADISWYIASDHAVAAPESLQELYEYYQETGCTIDHTKWDKEEQVEPEEDLP